MGWIANGGCRDDDGGDDDDGTYTPSASPCMPHEARSAALATTTSTREPLPSAARATRWPEGSVWMATSCTVPRYLMVMVTVEKAPMQQKQTQKNNKHNARHKTRPQAHA
jgi:hypothetical protein